MTRMSIWQQYAASLDENDTSELAAHIRSQAYQEESRVEMDRMKNQERLRRSYLSEDEYSVSDDGQLINRNGIEWHEAPIPKRFLHLHDVWTRMYGGLDITDRCACGAIRSNMVAGGRWCLIDGWRKA